MFINKTEENKFISIRWNARCTKKVYCLVPPCGMSASPFENKMAVTSTTLDSWLVTNDGKVSAKKPKRIAKHKKKAWRITSNVDDVEQYLETKRREERTG